MHTVDTFMAPRVLHEHISKWHEFFSSFLDRAQIESGETAAQVLCQAVKCMRSLSPKSSSPKRKTSWLE